MTERSLFWDTELLADGGPYTQAHLHDQFLRSLINGTGNRGPINHWRSELAVSGNSSPLSVATGGACVYGMLFDMDEATTVSVPTPSAGVSRYDVVCLQRDWANQTVRVSRHSGVAAGAPAIPTLTQTAGTYWETPLATILVDDAGTITVTDSREFCTYSSEWAANIIIAGLYGEGAVTPAKIPDRTRYRSTDLHPDATNPCTRVAGASYDFWNFAAGVTNEAWAYFIIPSDVVGNQASFYLWNGPVAAAAGNVKWDYNIYHGAATESVGTQLTNTAGTVAVVAQGGRLVANIYRDLIYANLVVSDGDIVAFQLERDGGAGADTFANAVRGLILEIIWTADA